MQSAQPGDVSVGVAGYGYWGPNLVRNFKGVPADEREKILSGNATRVWNLDK